MNDKERIRNHRESSGAVGDIGIIETGLSFQRAASKKSIDSLFKPGCVQLTKCEAHKSSLAKRFKLFRNRITQVSSSGEGDGNKTLLHPMKISIPEGSITAILGTADSGKSTLMKFIAGCLDKNVEWDGIGKFNFVDCTVSLELTVWSFLDGLSESSGNKIIEPTGHRTSWIYTKNIYQAL